MESSHESSNCMRCLKAHTNSTSYWSCKSLWVASWDKECRCQGFNVTTRFLWQNTHTHMHINVQTISPCKLCIVQQCSDCLKELSTRFINSSSLKSLYFSKHSSFVFSLLSNTSRLHALEQYHSACTETVLAYIRVDMQFLKLSQITDKTFWLPLIN